MIRTAVVGCYPLKFSLYSSYYASRMSRRSLASVKVNTFLFQRRIFIASSSSVHNALFHTTTINCAKSKSAKAGGGAKSVESTDTKPDVKSIEKLMESRIDRLVDEFSKLRAGKASSDMFNHIRVDVNGARASVPELGQVTLKSANKIAISIFDPSMTALVSEAIRDGDLGVNPAVEGNVIVITIPKPSAEAREALLKVASKLAEKVIRNHPRKWMVI